MLRVDGEAAAAIATAETAAGAHAHQLGFVHHDVRALARTLAGGGMGPWTVQEYGADAFRSREFLGRPGDYTTRSAVWGAGRLGLVEPVTGDGAFRRALDERGPGLHHIGLFVDDAEPTADRLRAAGGSEVMRSTGHGLDGDGDLRFFAVPGTTCLVELIVRPRRRLASTETIG